MTFAASDGDFFGGEYHLAHREGLTYENASVNPKTVPEVTVNCLWQSRFHLSRPDGEVSNLPESDGRDGDPVAYVSIPVWYHWCGLINAWYVPS